MVRLERRAAALAIIAFAAGLLILGCNTGKQDLSKSPVPETTVPSYDLQLLGQSCDTDATRDSVVVTGTVRNVAVADHDGIIVLAIFLNEAGAQVAQADGSLSPPDLASQAIGNFRAQTKNSSEIDRCVVRFVSRAGLPLRVDYAPVQSTTPEAPVPTP